MQIIHDIHFIIIDLFCGAGGTTTGFEDAELNVPSVKLAKVIACVNHDPIAIKSHWANHPDVEHFEEDIRVLDPFTRLRRLVEIYRAFYPKAKVILWASLECTNFSKAKGGLPREADSRTLADHLDKYILALDPDYVKIENVVEFMSWGPLDENGKPISRKQGRDWIRWRERIKALGYYDDWKEMNSANFGALTSRNRLFGCFAKPHLSIIWPENTHAKNPGKGLIYSNLKKWEPVKKALDFDDEGNSVFNRKKDLSTKTMQRLFMGCVKRIAGGDSHFISKYFSGRPMDKNISVNGPAGTIKTKDGQAIVKACFIDQRNGNNPESRNSSIEDPARTLTAIGGNQQIVTAFISKYNSNNKKTGGHPGHSIEDPAPVVSTQNRLAKVQANFISRYNGVNGGKHDNSRSVESPIGALGCGDNQAKVTANFLNLYYSGGGQTGSIEDPSGTIPTHDRIAKVQADFFLDKQYFKYAQSASVDSPAGTILPNDKHRLVKADRFIMPTQFDVRSLSIEEPAPTLTANRHHHYIVNPSWGGHSGSVEEPCHVVIARQDKAPLYLITCSEGPVAVPVYAGDCEWTIKLKQFMALYGITDIKMRMLKVLELKLIQGFRSSYVLLGNQSDQKKSIGNAVHPLVPRHWIIAMDSKLFFNLAA